jgi:hypothetical protein
VDAEGIDAAGVSLCSARGGTWVLCDGGGAGSEVVSSLTEVFTSSVGEVGCVSGSTGTANSLSSAPYKSKDSLIFFLLIHRMEFALLPP